jgi:hypothetical protein
MMQNLPVLEQARDGARHTGSGRQPDKARQNVRLLSCALEKHEVVVDGLGEFNGLDYLAAARTHDGVTVIAYLPSSRTFIVDMTKVAGKAAKAWWYSPRTGKSQVAGEFTTAGKRQFTPPAEGDWLFILDDASRMLRAPGEL